jgi:L-seryl-tRNA(Ser) seleniumtransferase
MKTPRRTIPAVGKLLEALGPVELPRPFVTHIVRQHLASLRGSEDIPSFDQIMRDLCEAVGRIEGSRLQSLINGTGIVIHTNFGRAPLGAATIRAITEIGSSYNNLEYDLTTGTRGKRGGYLEQSLALLCGGEAATVVNNCAAALVLIVHHFTRKKPEIIISRGELVQIGGGFRIGEILEASGARLREVGATNKTALRDYEQAVGPATAMILKVHQSNFFIAGFAGSPPNEEIARLARAKRIPFVEDLGSGAVVATEKMGLVDHEPTPNESLKAGADLVCFSGDKLLGGPQAGIIAGRARLIAALRGEPLFRALRCDKLIFAALTATADAHLRKAWEEIPVLRLLQTSTDALRMRADALVRQLRTLPVTARVAQSRAEIGGGALPRAVIPSIALELSSSTISPNELAHRLRQARPAVVGCIARNKFRIDLRTVFPTQDESIVIALEQAVAKLDLRKQVPSEGLAAASRDSNS